MKNYEVRMTMLVAVTVNVEAENAEVAEKLAMEKTGNEEAYYLHHYDSVWEREVTEVNECEPTDTRTVIDKAIDYVRQQLEPDELAEIRAQVDRSYRYHMMPSDCVTSTDRVIELLGEYGKDYEDVSEDNAEDWWSPHIDIDDLLIRL